MIANFCRKCGLEMSKWGKQTTDQKQRWHCLACAEKKKALKLSGSAWTPQKQIACALYVIGFWLSLIAKWMGLSHTTVSNLVKPFARSKPTHNVRPLPVVTVVQPFPAPSTILHYADIGRHGSILLDLEGKLPDRIFEKSGPLLEPGF
jgi:hypothetical protein